MTSPACSGSAQGWFQWQLGDWEALANKGDDVSSPTDLALKAAAQLQLGRRPSARETLQRALDAGCDRELIARLLLSGACNAVANAHALLHRPAHAFRSFEEALSLTPDTADVALSARTRAANESARLGLPATMGSPDAAHATLDDHAWITRGVNAAPDSVPLLIAAAEHAQRHGRHVDAVRFWQRVAALDGAHMAAGHYARLEEAYRLLKSFPASTPEEETLRGDVDKHRVLAHVHRHLLPRRYLEIGVQSGRSLALAECPAFGVDPMPMVSVTLRPDVRVVQATSDDFFAGPHEQCDLTPLDLVFIDGMHLFEFALRDLIHVQRLAGPHTLVLIDDILPGHPAQASRDRRTRAWTGDVWKLLPALRQHQPDLQLLLLDTRPTGLLCVSGFTPGDTRLAAAYEHLVSSAASDSLPPPDIIDRRGAVPSLGPELQRLIESLRQARGSSRV